MVTDASIYRESPQSRSGLSSPGTKRAPIFDKKHADFFNSVKPEDVKVKLDENGEPMFSKSQFVRSIYPM